MTKILVNLTLPEVVEEIGNILEGSENRRYQQAFAIPDLHQELIAYVLSRVPNFYVAIEEEEPTAALPREVYQPTDRLLSIEMAVYRGIQELLNEKATWIEQHLLREAEQESSASQWFG